MANLKAKRKKGGRTGTLVKKGAPPKVVEDVWIPSFCTLTNDGPCGIKIHRVNGVAVKIEGNDQHPSNKGVICPKGNSGILKLYDPNRIKSPLKRTNPEKGIGVDPKWVEISWDEALNITAEKLKKIYLEDGLKVLSASRERGGLQGTLIDVFAKLIGATDGKFDGGGMRCTTTEHVLGTATHLSFACQPDLKRCNYVIYFGRNPVATLGAPGNRVLGEARARGLKMVVVDPVMTVSAAKADEWIPIKSGTDGVVILSMLNVIINELGTYDQEFLKKWTNAPYLVGPDGLFLRKEVEVNGKAVRKPLVWDKQGGKTKFFDDPTAKDCALLGDYEVDGVRCCPAFQLLKEHVRQYTPELAAEVSQIPAATIRRLSQEFVQAAQIGSTIVIDGKEFPFRPAATKLGRGVNARQNSSHAFLANEILNMLVGSVEIPGGHLGTGGHGTHRIVTGKNISDDGTLISRFIMKWKFPPERIDGADTLYYYGYGQPHTTVLNILNPEKLSFNFRLEALIRYHTNGILSIGDPNRVAEALKKIPFILSFSLTNDEMTEFADIVFPDAMYLERWEPVDLGTDLNNTGVKWIGMQLRQPVVPPQYQCREIPDVLTDLAEKMGILDRWNLALNEKLELKPPYTIEPNKKYQWQDLAERMVRSRGIDLEELKKNGFVGAYQSDSTAYMLYDGKAKFRLPLYQEELQRAGEQLKNNLAKVGIDWWDTSDYVALPYWREGSLRQAPPEYDLVCTYHRSIVLAQANTVNNPYCIEVLEQEAYITKVRIHPETAGKRGIRDGDYVHVDSQWGKIKAKAALSEGIHPDVIAMGGAFGQWATPLIKDLDWVNISTLSQLSFNEADPVSGCIEGHGIAVKLYKA